MPIDIKQFEEATKPLAIRIRDFLANNSTQAYSIFEIMAALDGYPDASTATFLVAMERVGGKQSATWERYWGAVEELVKRNEVRGAPIQGATYYAYNATGKKP
jgi:hypothetical protein